MKKLIKKSLLITGSLLCLHASWLPIKGWLSEQLISYSWHQTIDLKQQIKPWPWADTYPIAELSFERLNKQVVVLNGGDPTTLAFSAGAIAPFNQALSTQAFVVAGHKDSHFSFLDEVVMNDIISLADKHGQSQLYQVEAIDIVDASTGELPVLGDDSQLILITCYPFTNTRNIANVAGSNSNERYVITARLL
ncbi:class GN sortase [Colwellia psychrerythraea]|uniref:Sortase n=1 Tax=Colwellia psychrerythraea TaxID=28229 RepID=A0A099KIW5_COLPS|nr:class GN sortase [Colwellia psychrerythraea]KGJ90769.1 sortase [Colwellia psychrerythraea]